MLLQFALFDSFYGWIIIYIYIYIKQWAIVYSYHYHIFLSQSSVNGNLYCFHVFAIVNRAAVNISVHVFFNFLSFLDIYKEVGLLDHMVSLFLDFWGTCILFSTVTAPVYIPTNRVGDSLFSAPSLAFVICRFLDDGHSAWCEVMHCCDFDFHFSNN